MGRPRKYSGDARVCVRSTGETKLQKASDRRAIVDVLIDAGGCMTLDEIDAHFGFDIRDRVLALERAGWLEVTP